MACCWILGVISAVVLTHCAARVGRINTLDLPWWWCMLFGLSLGMCMVVMLLLSVQVCQRLGYGLSQ
jgi:hypothetical protein